MFSNSHSNVDTQNRSCTLMILWILNVLVGRNLMEYHRIIIFNMITFFTAVSHKDKYIYISTIE